MSAMEIGCPCFATCSAMYATVPSVMARLGMAHRRLHELRVAEDALTTKVRSIAHVASESRSK